MKALLHFSAVMAAVAFGYEYIQWFRPTDYVTAGERWWCATGGAAIFLYAWECRP